MVDCVYVIYNKLSNRYESVVSFATDAVMIKTMQNGKLKKDVYDVCKVGEVDLMTGCIKSEPPVRIEIPELEEEPLPVSEAK